MAETAISATSRPLQVSQLTRYVKALVERDEILASLVVEGEICDFSRSAAGHVYFGLKDATSQVPCVLFRREAAQQLEEVERLRKGLAVTVHGFLTVYEPRGSYQIYVERVQAQGDGIFFQRFERLRLKLEGEGLFAPERKRALPPYPRAVALITSPKSQAYHDVLHRLSTQYPFVRVIEAGASVQGDGAAAEVAMAIDIVNRLTDADVILVVRGGGAPEDLIAFNDERLARTIYASRIPIVTGIGHETDYTIADFVADHRAATPSLAAAAAVPDVRALVDRAYQMHGELSGALQHRLESARARWIGINKAMLAASPENRLRTQRQRSDELMHAAERSIHVHLRKERSRLNAQQGQLRALDPLAILARGYAVLTNDETGRVVSTVAAAEEGTRLRAQVSDGDFIVRRVVE